MKIATFNINNVRKRLPNLLAWLRAAKPDVVCLQELKATDARVSRPTRSRKAGYDAVWRGQKTWNGVAILARGSEPVVTRTELPGDPADTQSRYIEAAVNGVLIASLYAPNGNPQPGPKFDYKLAWMKRLDAPCRRRSTRPACRSCSPATTTWCRPTRDIYPTKSYDDDALLQPQSRAAFRRLLAQGWIDAIRTLHPDAPMYTFWDYMRNRWERDAGLRLDHILLSAELAGAPRRRRRRSRGARQAERQRSRAGLGRAARRVPKPPQDRTTKRSARHRGQARKARSPPAASRAPASHQRTSADRCWSSTAIPSRIAPITRCRRTILRAGRQAGRRHPRLCQFPAALLSERSSRAPCWSVGTRSKAPTYRHEQFPAYQSGREFDDALRRATRRAARARGRLRLRERQGGRLRGRRFPRRGGRRARRSAAAPCWSRAATATPSSSPPTRPPSSIPCAPARWRASTPAEVRARYGVDPQQVPDFIALRGDPVRQAAGRAQASARRAPPTCCAATARSKPRSRPAALPRRPRSCGSIARSPP